MIKTIQQLSLELTDQVEIRLKLIRESLVGTLYPNILIGEIERINEARSILDGHTKRAG